MSPQQKFKSNSYCFGGTHYSDINNTKGVITSKRTKMLKGNCNKGNRNMSMTVSDAKKEAEGLKKLFKSVGRATIKLERKLLIIQ